MASECGPAGIAADRPQLLLDADQLVVLGQPIRAGETARLDLAAVGRDREVRNRRILRLARAMRHDGGVARALRHADGLERLAERADLIDFHQQRVGYAALDPL